MGRDGGITTLEPEACRAQARLHDLDFDALGVRFTIRSNDAGILAAVEELCHDWQAESDGLGARLEMEIEICPSASPACSLRILAEAACLRLDGPGLRAWADPATGRATCVASRGWADSGRLAAEAIEPLMLFLLAHADRTPIHASACIIDELAIVLAGRTGTGKSCLAYAARAAGLALLSDDTVHVQLDPSLRVWGIPRPIHVYPADAPAGAQGPLRWRNGKLKQAIEHGGNRAAAARRAVLCLIEPGDAVALRIVRSQDGAPRFPSLEPGFDLLPAQSHAAYSALSARGFARLTLGANPADAIRELCRRRGELAGIATA